MDLVYISHKGLETLYPLMRREKPVSSLSLLGKNMLHYIYTHATGANMENIIHLTSSRKFFQIDANGNEMLENLNVIECDIIAKCAEDAADLYEREHIMVSLGTIIPSSEKVYESIIARWNETGGDILLALTPAFQVPEARGLFSIRIKIDLNLTEVDKNNLGKSTGEGYYFTGLMIIRTKLLKKMFDYMSMETRLTEKSLETDVPKRFTSFLKKTHETITYHILTLPVYPVNTPWNLLRAMQELLGKLDKQYISSEAKVSPSSVIEGPVIIEKGAFIDHGAVIKGPVYIGENSLVGANSFVRSYVSLESKAKVGALSEIKRTYLGKNATVASHTHVSDSLLGDGATLRPMSVTLNYDPHEGRFKQVYEKRGAIIGEDSIVDGGSVLKPGTIIGPSSIFKHRGFSESE